MASNPELKVRITGDLTAIRNSLAGLQTSLATLDQRLAKVGSNTAGLAKLEASLGRMKASVIGLAASLGASFSVAQLVALSDEAANVNARLNLATKSTQEFAVAQQELFRIAQTTRVGLASTVDLYARLERSTRTLNLSQATLLQLTETIAKTTALSGGGAATEAALTQFAQLLSAGDLTAAAQEINSIQEQAPRLAEAIRKGLDELGIKGPASLKKLVSEGGVQVVDILKAIQTQVGAVDDEFKQLPATIGGGFTQIRNAFVQYLAQSTEANASSRRVAEALRQIADNMPTLVNAFVTIVRIGVPYLVFFRALPALYTAMIALSGGLAKAQLNLGAAFTAAGTAGARAAFVIRSAFGLLFAFMVGKEIGNFLRTEFVEVEVAGIALVNGLLVVWERMKQGARVAALAFTNAFEIAFSTLKTGIANLVGAYAKLYEAVGANDTSALFRGIERAVRPAGNAVDDFKKKVAAIGAEAEASIQKIDDEFFALADAARKAAANRGKPAAVEGETTITGGGTGEADAKLKAFYDQNIDLLIDASQRALRELDRLYEGGKVSIAKYYAEKTRLEQEGIDLQIQQARGELGVAKTRQDQEKILATIIKLEKDRAEAGVVNAEAQAAAELKYRQALEDVEARLAEAQGKVGERAALELQRERDELLAKFKDDPRATKLVEQLFNIELAKARADAIGTEADRIMQRLRDETQLLANETELGAVTASDAEDRLQAKREETIRQLEELRRKAVEAYNAAPSEETLAKIRELDVSIGQVQQSQSSLGKEVQKQAESSLANFFTDLATGAKSFKDAFRDMVVSFIQGLARMAAEALAKKIILSVFGAFGGGAGNAFAAGGASAGVFHGGGMAGHGMKRTVSPLLFAGAPRFKTGGMGVDLGPGEFPAILHTGERVLNQEETKRYNAGDRPAPGTRIVNVLDPTLVTDQMDSAEGERVILNVIARNPGRIKQVLA